jgi:hypothetical protein
MMKNIFSKFLTSKKNRKRLSMSDSNEFGGIISKSSPIAIVDEPITFTSTVDFTDATINGITSGWSLDGNSGTDPNVNFIGTTDNKVLKFKTNNTDVATLPSGATGNIIIGKESIAVSNNNIVFGNASNQTNNGNTNVLLGNNIQKLSGDTGSASFNVIAGHNSGGKNRSGNNTILGYNSAVNILTNSGANVIIGNQTANGLANPSNIINTIDSYSSDANWSKINNFTWQTIGAVTDVVETNFYSPFISNFSLNYNITFSRTISAGSINFVISTLSGNNDFGTYSTTGNSTFNFSQQGAFFIIAIPSADFSGSFSLNLVHTGVDRINNSVIIGGNAKPKDNNSNNEIVIGHNAAGKGSGTVQIGNTFVTDTYLQGNLQLPAYGDGTITGTPTKALAVDTDGKVLEVPYNNAQVYVALLSQAGTAAPTAVVLENSVGNVTYTRDSAGVYNVVLPSTITNGISRIYATIQTNTTAKYLIVSDMPATDVSTFQIECTGEGLSDDFTRAKFEIRIYP